MARIQRRDLLKGAAATAVGVTLAPGTPAAAAPLSRCDTPAARDFPKVGGNLGNQNFSALGGIDRRNVRRLGAAWVNRIEGGITTGGNESTAVAVDGVIYIESTLGNVFAVDGGTG